MRTRVTRAGHAPSTPGLDLNFAFLYRLKTTAPGNPVSWGGLRRDVAPLFPPLFPPLCPLCLRDSAATRGCDRFRRPRKRSEEQGLGFLGFLGFRGLGFRASKDGGRCRSGRLQEALQES